MKILLVTDRFHPSVGGVETVTHLLGEAFAAAGHSVSVVTRQKAPSDTAQNPRDGCPSPRGLGMGAPASRRRGPLFETPSLAGEASALPGDSGRLIPAFPFKLWRRPGMIRLLREHAIADAVIVQGLAGRLAWPLLWFGKGALMVHHMRTVVGEDGVSGSWRAKLGRKVRHATVSRALAKELPWPVEAILPNPYDDMIFRFDRNCTRTRDIVFVGRLIAEKGAHVLIEALALLRDAGAPVTTTIVGDGPEKRRLAEFIHARDLDRWVHLAGQFAGSGLAQLLNQHRVLAVPSLCEEAFGLVALEAIACGCGIVASDAGGLPEAIGLCGMTFPKGDAGSLAARVEYLVHSPDAIAGFRAAAERHLAPHRPGAVAQSYLDFLSKPALATSEPWREMAQYG